MRFSSRFGQGMKAAIPIWIAFVPSSLAWGIAAQAHGLELEEVIFMSAWVYSGPAQFAVLAPLGVWCCARFPDRVRRAVEIYPAGLFRGFAGRGNARLGDAAHLLGRSGYGDPRRPGQPRMGLAG
ncbi:MAG: hypothetical protein GEU77_17845 [Deltaproteobacteria bacterium]|nr:hypothetical protein [Deltaproteobacteria bacterium]